MIDDTHIGGTQNKFPTTHLSAVMAARSENSLDWKRAFETIISVYWKPVYKTIRIKWKKSNEDAKDLTQEFFLTVMEKDFLSAYDPSKARFRTFIRTCLDRFLINQDKASKRMKRGGGVRRLSFDFAEAEGEIRHLKDVDLDVLFDREWLRSLYQSAIEELRKACRRKGKSVQFDIFARYDLEQDESSNKLSYADLAQSFDMPVTQITNALSYVRQELRGIVLEQLRELTSDEREFREEARWVLGIDLE